MRARTIVLLFVAVVLAVGTAMLARSWLAAQRSRELAAIPTAPQVAARSVLVARNKILRGQILRPDDLMWQVWPAGSIDKAYILSGGAKKPDSFAGWVAVNPIAGGQPVTDANIISPGNRGFLSAVLRPGTRAISVPVTVTSGIAGFIFPGDYVDILLTYPFPSASATGKAGYEHKAAETVLHNIRVIGIDQRLESKAGEAFPAHTATFEVTPKQSEVIALATDIGKLSLTLHSLRGAPESTAASEAADKSQSDSFNSAAVTYTVDSEISPLLPKFITNKEASEEATVTILRGAAKSSEAINLSKVGARGEPTKSAGGT
jgi:pilus assembly protein CpaB